MVCWRSMPCRWLSFKVSGRRCYFNQLHLYAWRVFPFPSLHLIKVYGFRFLCVVGLQSIPGIPVSCLPASRSFWHPYPGSFSYLTLCFWASSSLSSMFDFEENLSSDQGATEPANVVSIKTPQRWQLSSILTCLKDSLREGQACLPSWAETNSEGAMTSVPQLTTGLNTDKSTIRQKYQVYNSLIELTPLNIVI